MRKTYVDNIRWMTVVTVVIYHVLYMFNGVVTSGVIGPFEPVQYQDACQYFVYPWFMLLLFVISGMSARFYLNGHSDKEFLKSRTTKLLVPSTIGLFVFWLILCYYKMMISGANCLVLDEPTNHLDVDAKDELKRALIDYKGSILMVCHEPEFYDGLATDVWDCGKWTTRL